MKSLSIIILNYKTPKITLDCIASLWKFYLHELKYEEFEIILVDNFSNDDSISQFEKYLKKNPNSFRLIKNTKNAGFAGGCNYGARFATGVYLLFLNSDTRIFDRGLDNLIEIQKRDTKVAIVGGKLLKSNRVGQKNVGRFPDLWNVFANLIGIEYIIFVSCPEKIKEVDWVSGGCLMISKKVFTKLHGFDENFFMYMEDVEICFRTRKLGYKIKFCPFIKIIHKTGASSNFAFTIINTYKGYLYFFKKHRSNFQYNFLRRAFFIKAYVYYLSGIALHNLFLETTYKEVYKLCQ